VKTPHRGAILEWPAAGLIAAWRLSCHPLAQAWRDAVLVLVLFWMADRSILRPSVKYAARIGVMAYLMGVYLHIHLAFTLAYLQS